MKSFIKNKKPIKFGKVIVVSDLVVNQKAIKEFEKNIRNSNPKISEEKLNEEVHNMVAKDNYYNKIMDEVSSAYEFELDEEEVIEKLNLIKKMDPEMDDEQAKNISKISIIKQLIYDDLANDWELHLTDEQVRETLQNFYRSTGQPIREYLTNKEKFNEVKKTLREQIISDRLLNAFKANFLAKKTEKS